MQICVNCGNEYPEQNLSCPWCGYPAEMNDYPEKEFTIQLRPRFDLIRIRTVARVIDAFIGEGGFKASIPRFLADTGMRPYDLFGKLTDFIHENELEGKLGKTENLARILYAYAKHAYGIFEDDLNFEVLTGAIHADLESMVQEEAIIRFDRDGWDLV